MKKALLCIVAAITSALSVLASAEVTYPSKPVRVVVSYAPGNTTDQLARLIAQHLTERWGQQVIVDNRPGVGGSIGAQTVAKAPADGYTLLFTAVAAMAVNPHLYEKVGYGPLKDFAPIVLAARAPLIVAVHPSVPAANIPEPSSSPIRANKLRLCTTRREAARCPTSIWSD